MTVDEARALIVAYVGAGSPCNPDGSISDADVRRAMGSASEGTWKDHRDAMNIRRFVMADRSVTSCEVTQDDCGLCVTVTRTDPTLTDSFLVRKLADYAYQEEARDPTWIGAHGRILLVSVRRGIVDWYPAARTDATEGVGDP